MSTAAASNPEHLRMVRCLVGGLPVLMEARRIAAMGAAQNPTPAPLLADLLGLPRRPAALRRLELTAGPGPAALLVEEPVSLDMIAPDCLHAAPDMVRARITLPALIALAVVDQVMHLVLDPALLPAQSAE